MDRNSLTKLGEMPAMDSRGTFKMVLEEGGPGMCLFTITNACNARCRFCGFSHDLLPRQSWSFLKLEAAYDAIDILYQQGVRYLAIQGGEPPQKLNGDPEGPAPSEKPGFRSK